MSGHGRGARRAAGQGDCVEYLSTQLRVGHLTALEPNRHLDLVAILEEALDDPALEVDVVVVCLGRQTYFLQEHYFLVLAGLSLFLGLLVLELTVVQEAADWRDGIRGNLD